MWIIPHVFQKNCHRDFVGCQIHLGLLRRRFTSINPPFRLLLALGCVVMNPRFVHSSQTTQKVTQIAVEQHQTQLRSCQRIASVVKRGTHFTSSFLTPKWAFKTKTTKPRDTPTTSMISSTFNLRSANTVSWIFSIVSDVAASTGRPERSVPLVLVRPQRHSINHFLPFAPLMVLNPRSIYLDYPWFDWCFFVRKALGCLLSVAVKHKINDSAYSKFDKSRLMHSCWRERCWFSN